MTKDKIKIGVYGSYKKGFHNHEMLGKDAKFLGLSKIEGVMYLVTNFKDPFPLLYVNSVRAKTMQREYLLELYEIDESDFDKIKAKEEREDNMRVDLEIETGGQKNIYICFVTNPKEKKEPDANTYCKEFVKNSYGAFISGDITIHALDEETADKNLQEMLDDAADVLEKADRIDAAIIWRELKAYIRKTEEKPHQPVLLLKDTKKDETIQTS